MSTRAFQPSAGGARRGNRKLRDRSGSALFSELAWKEIGHSLKLSDRELQIVRGAFDDQTEFSIAANLKVARSTVHTYVERLHRKLGITDRAQLLVRVMEEFMMLTTSADNNLPPICANRASGSCPLQPKP